MSALKKTVSIDEAVVKEANDIMPNNFSAIVEAALIEYIHKFRIEKAIQSFGKWDDRKKKSIDIVNDLRREDDRELVVNHDKNEPKTPRN
jgi:hypothetical protein